LLTSFEPVRGFRSGGQRDRNLLFCRTPILLRPSATVFRLTCIDRFMNKFRKLGLIDYIGSIEVHSSLLNVVLRDQPQLRR
jgi:hypothetical protein